MRTHPPSDATHCARSSSGPTVSKVPTERLHGRRSGRRPSACRRGTFDPGRARRRCCACSSHGHACSSHEHDGHSTEDSRRPQPGRHRRRRRGPGAGCRSAPVDGSLVSDAELDGLPEAAQRYLRFMDVVGRPRAWSFRAHLAGRFRMRPGLPWMPCEAWQYSTSPQVNRVFHMRIDFAHVVPMVGHDTYLGGRGCMHGKVLGLVTVAHGVGAEFDIGELDDLPERRRLPRPVDAADKRRELVGGGCRQLRSQAHRRRPHRDCPCVPGRSGRAPGLQQRRPLRRPPRRPGKGPLDDADGGVLGPRRSASRPSGLGGLAPRRRALRVRPAQPVRRRRVQHLADRRSRSDLAGSDPAVFGRISRVHRDAAGRSRRRRGDDSHPGRPSTSIGFPWAPVRTSSASAAGCSRRFLPSFIGGSHVTSITPLSWYSCPKVGS